jgi:hypothetical protein
MDGVVRDHVLGPVLGEDGDRVRVDAPAVGDVAVADLVGAGEER